jgi:hypothetical protein
MPFAIVSKRGVTMAASKTKSKKLSVFLSHASQDAAMVRELCERLRADGFDPWLDKERLLPGQDWDFEIEKALRASDTILLCFSALSVEKEGYIQREYKRAMRYREEKPDGTIFVIPVRLDKCELPYFIREIQFVDYPDDYERLVVSLNLRRGKLTSSPPTPRTQAPPTPVANSVDSSHSNTFQGDTNTSGGVNIQAAKVRVGGDVVGGDKTVYGAQTSKANPLKRGFERIHNQINSLSDEGDMDKSYLMMFVKDIEKETAKGRAFNEKKLKSSLKMLMQQSEEIYTSVADLLRSPDSRVLPEIQDLVD